MKAIIGQNVRNFPVVESTNSLLKAEAESGIAGEGSVICTDYQTIGRGRLDRKWESPPGKSLLFSVLLYPGISPQIITLIGLAVSLAVYKALREYISNLNLEKPDHTNSIFLKWPNDILFSRKKICGILCETGLDNNERRFVVTGIGLNVNQAETDFSLKLNKPATSLLIETGMSHNRDSLLSCIILELNNFYGRIKESGTRWIADEWLSASGLLNTHIKVVQDKTIYGTCLGILENGALQLKTESGKVVDIYSGDVF